MAVFAYILYNLRILSFQCLSVKVIKPVIDSLSSPLTYIINLSFNEGIFPSELKIAQIIPLYKNDDPMQFNNYRPVSLLPFFSKLFERLMYNRLIDFINKYKLLYDYQFGFRKKSPHVPGISHIIGTNYNSSR